jgi:hypothetical protein
MLLVADGSLGVTVLQPPVYRGEMLPPPKNRGFQETPLLPIVALPVWGRRRAFSLREILLLRG